jgi:hypothetical protein
MAVEPAAAAAVPRKERLVNLMINLPIELRTSPTGESSPEVVFVVG